jgi:hypothetical protein
MSLAIEAGIMTKETAPMILARAEAEAAALTAKAREKGLK